MIYETNPYPPKRTQILPVLFTILLSTLLFYGSAKANESCTVNEKKIIKYLLQNNFTCFSKIIKTVPINDISNYKGLPLIHWAALNKETSFLLRTLEAGADVNRVNDVDPTMPTPIFFAIMSFNLKNVNLLITVGADLNVVNVAGWSPARYAAILNQYDMVLSLLKAGADWSIKDKDGLTLADQIQTGRIDKNSSGYEHLKQVITLLRSKGVAVHEPGEENN